MTFATQPNKFKHEGTFGKYRVYSLVNATDYHMSRYVQMQNQLIYANAGGNKERFEQIAQQIIQRCNLKTNYDARITDIGVLANEILYRSKYPVDEHCAVRMGAILSFIEADGVAPENPDTYDAFYTKIKEDLAFSDPAAYAFFLTWGIAHIQQYNQHFDTSIDLEYFSKRREALMSLSVPSQE